MVVFRTFALVLSCAACTSVSVNGRTLEGTHWRVVAIDGHQTARERRLSDGILGRPNIRPFRVQSMERKLCRGRKDAHSKASRFNQNGLRRAGDDVRESGTFGTQRAGPPNLAERTETETCQRGRLDRARAPALASLCRDLGWFVRTILGEIELFVGVTRKCLDRS